MTQEDLNKQSPLSSNEKINLFSRKPGCRKEPAAERACKHRHENGWCARSQRQCALANFAFIIP